MYIKFKKCCNWKKIKMNKIMFKNANVMSHVSRISDE